MQPSLITTKFEMNHSNAHHQQQHHHHYQKQHLQPSQPIRSSSKRFHSSSLTSSGASTPTGELPHKRRECLSNISQFCNQHSNASHQNYHNTQHHHHAHQQPVNSVELSSSSRNHYVRWQNHHHQQQLQQQQTGAIAKAIQSSIIQQQQHSQVPFVSHPLQLQQSQDQLSQSQSQPHENDFSFKEKQKRLARKARLLHDAKHSRHVILSVLSCLLEQLFPLRETDTLPSDPSQITMFHTERIPSITISAYLNRLAYYSECSSEVLIQSFIHLNRLRYHRPTMIINSLNIHRLLLVSLLCSAKFFDDMYYNNAFFAKIGGIPNKELNNLEIEFLALINFDLFIDHQSFEIFYNEMGSSHLHSKCTCDYLKFPSFQSVHYLLPRCPEDDEDDTRNNQEQYHHLSNQHHHEKDANKSKLNNHLLKQSEAALSEVSTTLIPETSSSSESESSIDDICIKPSNNTTTIRDDTSNDTSTFTVSITGISAPSSIPINNTSSLLPIASVSISTDLNQTQYSSSFTSLADTFEAIVHSSVEPVQPDTENDNDNDSLHIRDKRGVQILCSPSPVSTASEQSSRSSSRSSFSSEDELVAQEHQQQIKQLQQIQIVHDISSPSPTESSTPFTSTIETKIDNNNSYHAHSLHPLLNETNNQLLSATSLATFSHSQSQQLHAHQHAYYLPSSPYPYNSSIPVTIPYGPSITPNSNNLPVSYSPIPFVIQYPPGYPVSSTVIATAAHQPSLYFTHYDEVRQSPRHLVEPSMLY